MADTALHLLQHSLGVDEFGRGRQYRSHFVAGPGHDCYELCLALVAKGFMTMRAATPLSGGDPTFYVTPAGRQHVAEASPAPPKRSRGQRMYDCYLGLRDVCDLTFKEFLTQPRFADLRRTV